MFKEKKRTSGENVHMQHRLHRYLFSPFKYALLKSNAVSPLPRLPGRSPVARVCWVEAHGQMGGRDKGVTFICPCELL